MVCVLFVSCARAAETAEDIDEAFHMLHSRILELIGMELLQVAALLKEREKKRQSSSSSASGDAAEAAGVRADAKSEETDDTIWFGRPFLKFLLRCL